MKKILFYLTLFLFTKNVTSQNYYHTAGTVTTCKGQYYSSTGGPTKYGGTNGYANSEDITETFCSSTGGQFRVNFYWIDLQTNFDFLYIYDGPSTASPLIGTLTGSSLYPGVFTSSGTCLTFRFVSNGSTRWGGWRALFGCTPQPCGTNSLASDECTSAPVICNLNGYCGSTSGWFTRDHGNIEGSTWGGNNSFSCGSIQNNSWISFVAAGTSANFDITSSNCSDPSNGIQAVVFAQTACTTFTAVSSCQGNGVGTFALSATGLVAGQTYYIMIDGVDGNDCDYIVQATSGVQTVNITSGGQTACVGAAFTLTASATGTGPFTYSWSPTPNSGQSTSIASYTANTSTTYSVIITGACGSSQTATFYQTINPSPTVTIAGTNTVCSAGPGTTLTANAILGSNTISFSNESDYPIPDNNTTGVTSTISVSGVSGSVGTSLLSVCLNINHGYVADLDISLKCPNGTVIDLSSDNGGSGDNYTNTCFTPTGTAITLGAAPFTGSFTPEQALSLLSGCTANGTWSLTVKDDAAADVGTLLGWTMTFSNSVTYTWSPSTGLSSTSSSVVVASPTVTTVYSVTVTDKAGCTGTSPNFTVFVTPTPTVALTSLPTNSICLGSAISFTGSGASTYSWTATSGGGLSATTGSIVSATPTSTGNLTYSVVGTNGACTGSAAKTITVNPVPIANAGTGGTLTCSTTTLSLSGSGGGSYNWTGPSGGIVSGATSATPIVSVQGTYSLTVTNSSGCSSPVSTVAVSQNTIAPTVTSSVSSVLNCTLTSVNVVATTTVSPVSYTWTGPGITAGAGTASASVNQPGTYNYTVTNTSTGCKTTGTQSVTQNTVAPSITGISPTQTLACGSSAITLTASASPTTSLPAWLGGVTAGANSYTATAASANIYTLTITNPANGCTAVATTEVKPSPGSPVLSTPIISNSITCSQNSATVVVTTTTSPVTYLWSGTGITSGTTSNSISVNAAGNYTLQVTNSTFTTCVSTIVANVPLNNTPPAAEASNSTTLTCSTTTAVLTGGPSSGVTYQWSGPGLTGATTNSTAIANSPGTYTLIVTDAINGCTNTAFTTLTQNIAPPSPTATNSTTLTCLTTTATLNGGPSAGVTYTWSGPGIVSGTNSQNAVANAPGTYTLKVTDAVNGCTNTAVTTLTQNIVPPSPTATNSTTITCSITTAALTGGPSSGVTYQWNGPGFSGSTTNQNAIATLPGTYSLTVTSTVNGCSATATTAVSQNTTAPSSSITNTSTLTCVTTVVTFTGNPSTGVTYQWSGSGLVGATTNSTVQANSAGTYSLMVTSTVNGCTNTATTNLIADYTSPDVTATNNTTLTCSTTTATVFGGPASGATYSWSGPSIVGSTTQQNATVNAPGTYILVATSNITGCTNSAQTNVDQNINLPNPTAIPSGTLTCSSTTVMIVGTPSTGVTYTWTGAGIVSGVNSQSVTVNAQGNYTLTVTDVVSNCTNATDVSVMQNTVTPVVTSTVSGILTCATTTVNASATTTTSPVTYNWAGTGITSATNISTITVNQPGTFSYTITDTSNGCVKTGSQTVTQNITPPSTTASNSTTLTCAVLNATLTGGPSSGVTYQWSGPSLTGATTNSTAVANGPGNYTLVATSTANSCTATATTSVTQNITAPATTASNSTTLTCAVLNATLTGGPSSGVTYQWSGPSLTGATTNSTAVANGPGNYTLVATNIVNSCTAAATASVTQNIVTPTTTATTTGSITCTTNTVNLNSTLSGMNYTWTALGGSSIVSGSSLQNAVGQGLGTYTLNVLNPVNSCTFQTSVAAIQNTTTPSSVEAGPNQALICNTPTLSLLGSATPSTSIANWLGGVSNPSTFTTSTGAAGVYTLQAIEPTTGCFISDTVRVTQSVESPTVTSNPVTNSITCTNSVVAIGISVTSSETYNIAWATGTGISGPTNSLTTTATLSGVYQVTVTNTGNLCISINSINVPIDQTPVSVSVTPASSITCLNPTETLNISPAGSNYTYTWTGSGIVSGGSTTNPVVNTGGDYSVTVTNTVNGCTGTGTVNVPLDISTPTVTISSPTVQTTCSNPTATINATSSPSTGVTYSWTAPASGSLNTYTVSNPVASGSGIFTVVVTTTVNGCSSSLTENTVEVIADAAIPTTTLTSNTETITCSNPTPTINIAVSTNSVSYSWTPTSGIVAGTENTATPSFSVNGSYSVVVTNTATGCATDISSNVVDIDIDNTEPVISLSTATNDGTITCTNTFVIVTPTVTPSSNLTYTWSPSTGVSTPVNEANATFTASGIYTLSVTNTLTGCINTSTGTANTFTVIEDNLAPTFTLGTASTVTTTCASPDATLSASSSEDPNVVYSWLTPTSTTLTGSPVTVSATGIYSVVITNTNNGCSTSAASSQSTVEVIEDAGIPSLTMSTNSVVITCSDPAPSVSVSTTASPVTYSWSPSSGIVPGTETTATPIFTAQGSYSVVVANTTSGCASSISSNVVTVTEDNLPPEIILSLSLNEGTITCVNPSVPITPTITSTGSLSDLTYTWSPSGVTSNTINDAAFTAGGIYTLAVTNNLTGCVTTSTNTANTFTVTDIRTNVTATINAISSNTIIGCGASSSSVVLEGTSSATTPSYTWMPGSVNSQTIAVTAGDYTLSVEDVSNGCSTFTVFTVSGNTTTPQISIPVPNVDISCGSSTVTLNGTSTSTDVTYSWVGPSLTSILSGSNTPSPLVIDTGSYTLTVTDNLTGCESTGTVVVSQGNVTAAFTADPSTSTSPLTVNFTDASTGATSWTWNFGDSNSSSSQNPSNVYTTGSYTVTLTASSGSCTGTATLVIVVEDGLTLEIPNVFTPNGDNSNDLFTIKSTGVKEISLQIFNRWGEKMYEFSGPKASWDGLAPNGLQVPEGTYFYFVKAKGFDDAEVEKHGSMNLFR